MENNAQVNYMKRQAIKMLQEIDDARAIRFVYFFIKHWMEPDNAGKEAKQA